MKKEELMKIEGMTDELADKVVELSTAEMKDMVPKTRLNEVIKERDNAKADHADVLKQLGALQKETADTDVEGLKQKITELETASKNAAKAHENEIKQLKIDNAVDAALLSAKARNSKAVKALLDLENAELDEDGTVKGLADQIKALQTAEDSKFMFGSATKLKGASFGESGDSGDGSAMTLEAFRKLSPVDRYNFSTEHPDEYKKLYENGGN